MAPWSRSEVRIALFAARSLVRLLPFGIVHDILGKYARSGRPLYSVDPVGTALSSAVSDAVAATDSTATCLVQALAGQFLLRRKGWASQIHIGARHGSEGSLEAHAWLQCLGGTILGSELAPQYQKLVPGKSDPASYLS